MRPTSALLRDYDWKQPTTNPTREFRGHDAQNRDREIFVASPVVTTADLDQSTGLPKNEFGTKQAELVIEGECARERYLFGHSNVVGVRPGSVLEVEAHAHPDLDGKYLVIAVHHEGTSPEGMARADHGDTVAAQYTNHFECMPVDVVFRPKQPAPRPVVAGPHTAIVVGPGKEEVYTDKYGRIKVQFHWDREGAHDEKSSCWMRVAQG